MSEEGNANESSTQITFNVKSSNDARHTISTADNITVGDLKQKLSTPEYANFPADRQRLIYSGRVMKDGDTLASYKIKDGNTIHLVRGAASNQQRNPETAGQSNTSSQVPPNAGVPQNLATGTGTDPLAGLTGARYAGFAQMPGANTFGPDGGMNLSNDPEEMIRMLDNPMVQAQFNEAMNNPHVIQMLQNNPMIRDQPMMREMLNNPEFRRMMFDPNFLRQSMQMQRAMGGMRMPGMGGGNTGMPAPGMTDMTPQEGGQQNQQGQGQGQQGQPGTTADGSQGPPNMFSMLQGLGGAPSQGTSQPGNPFAFLNAMQGMNPTGQTQQQPGANAQTQPNSSGPTTQPNSNTEATTSTSDANSSNPSTNPQQTQDNPFAALFGGGQQPHQEGYSNAIFEMANRMMRDPEMMRQAMSNVGLGNPPAGQQPAGQQGGQTGQGGQPPPFNPFAMLGGMPGGLGGLGGGMGGGLGGPGAPPQQQDSRPPEELYSEQLRQLNEMGFYDFDRNVRALRMAGGRVEGAIEMLFSGAI